MNSSASRSIPAEMFTMCDQKLLVVLNFLYSSDDPFAIHMGISLGDALAAQWVFSRDLAISGMDIKSGSGAVSIWPAVNDSIVIRITGGGKSALLRLSMNSFGNFINETRDLVSCGEELKNVDIGEAVARQCGMTAGQ